jgi:ribosomal RNA-processing protein 8
LMAKQNKNEVPAPSNGKAAGDSSSLSNLEDADSSQNPSSTLQNAFKARLSGSRFRILNEELYTKTSEESFERFSQNPELFEQYHEGFRHQVESWPVNPVDVIVRWLSSKYQKSQCDVADFGCGDAQLANDLLKIKRKGETPFTVHSFDLVSPNKLVTACDMANVPLKNKSVDVCVFCLSLMGTNLADFIREAHRVLKDDGKVKIAEVRSRIEYSHSKSSSKASDKDTTKKAGTLSEFVDVLNDLGFKCTKKDLSNKMFLVLELEKTGKAPNKKLEFSAKPCIYKRR